MAHAYPTLNEARLALSRVADMIERNGTPKDFGPLVYTFTGGGNVAQVRGNNSEQGNTNGLTCKKGAMEIFKELPHEFVPAQDLEKIVNDKSKVIFTLIVFELTSTFFRSKLKQALCGSTRRHGLHCDKGWK